VEEPEASQDGKGSPTPADTLGTVPETTTLARTGVEGGRPLAAAGALLALGLGLTLLQRRRVSRG